MVVSGKQILEDAFALLGTFAPGTQIERRLIDQSVRFANSKIEELSQRSSQIPGTTIQDLVISSSRTDYWLGPTAGTSALPGLKTSGAPDLIETALFVDDATGEPNISPSASVGVVRNVEEWAGLKRTAASGGNLWLYLHGGSGSAELGDDRSYQMGNRKLEVFPAFTSTIRLYMRVPEIQSIDLDTRYDLPPGVHRTLTTNIADALTTVFGADPQTVMDLHAQAAHAAGEQQKKNLRGRRPAAHLPARWITTVSDDGDTFVSDRVF